jgi:UDP-N-acetylmuramoyl-tripeptide--D-alanyl-D-alanine ligase
VELDAAGRLSLTVDDQLLGEEVRVDTALVGEALAIDVLAAVAGAAGAGVSLDRVAPVLDGVKIASPHRMAVAELGGGVTLLDDSYNASPQSMTAAVKTAAQLARRSDAAAVAVLGPMGELGAAAKEEHAALGALVAGEGFARLIAVGRGARRLADHAIEAGMAPEAVTRVDSAAKAASLIRQIDGPAVVLLKGSHASGLWRAAEDLMDGPGAGGGPT